LQFYLLLYSASARKGSQVHKEITIAAAPRSWRNMIDASLVKLAVIALCVAAALWFLPSVLDIFMVNVLTRSMIYAMLAVTVDLLWGFTGFLTYGQAAFFGAGAYAAAMVLTHLGASPGLIVLAFVLAVVVPIILGLIVGWLSFYHGSTPFNAPISTFSVLIKSQAAMAPWRS